MTDRDLLDVMRNQRACRWFTEDDVPDEDLDRMLDAAVHAPSAENAQPWVFVVVRDAGQRERIADLACQVWEGGGRAHAEAHTDGRTFADVDRAIEAGFGRAPVLVVVGGDTTLVPRRALGSSLFPAVQNLLLAANALGYGSALTTIATIPADDLRSVLDLPGHVEPVAVVPIGRPARTLGPSRRQPASTKTHRDRYGEGAQ